jgi:hypothetical protein
MIEKSGDFLEPFSPEPTERLTTSAVAAAPSINGQHKSLVGKNKHCSPLGIFSCCL